MSRTQDALAISRGCLVLLQLGCSLQRQRILIFLARSLLDPDPLLSDSNVSGASIGRLHQPLCLVALLGWSSVADGLRLGFSLQLFGVTRRFNSVLPVVDPLDQLEAGIRLLTLSGGKSLIEALQALWVQSADVGSVGGGTRVKQLLYFDVLRLDELLVHNLNRGSRNVEFLKVYINQLKYLK